ncbi:tRNA lysidine(34) synthetase TilS [Pseudoflavonifractor phocaeensis]|uniref:tRNA lysidine(34) synthetase TilS n=1 Tax=Pseudoflavonifractor phocaeensis TaxID=1870988 RepID=UPI00195C6965|nr:tRNA lysidine(34) synthetase TilS [Pseudoflavonifractor phocaeensis]MBM6870045.1 tRNA lysidine(34) synthetase TilS [Pseudoflavonifractor phocaeensis]
MSTPDFSQLNTLAAEYGMLLPGSTVLCAVSGGADSIYLLHRLTLLRGILGFHLAAAHYDHGLRPTSQRDTAFVARFVEEWCGEEVHTDGTVLPPVPLFVGRGDVAAAAKARKAGIEETARAMRYAFLQETAQTIGADVIATAHTADDNAETILLHLIRGSGLGGLCGIPPRRGNLIRPMLTTTRATVEQYLALYGLPHVEDESNADDAYARNRVRHQLLPLLEGYNPGFVDRMTHTAAVLRADHDYLNAQAYPLLRQVRQSPEGLLLPAEALARLPQALAVRGARLVLGKARDGDDTCTARHLEAIVDLARSARPSGSVELSGGLTVRRVYGELLFTFAASASLTPTPLALDGETWPEGSLYGCRCVPARCPGTPEPGVWYLTPFGGTPMLRPRQTGDALCLPGGRTRTVKKLLIDRRIPRHLRERLPVLADEGGVAALAGFGPAQDRLARPGERAYRLEFVPGETLLTWRKSLKRKETGL